MGDRGQSLTLHPHNKQTNKHVNNKEESLYGRQRSKSHLFVLFLDAAGEDEDVMVPGQSPTADQPLLLDLVTKQLPLAPCGRVQGKPRPPGHAHIAPTVAHNCILKRTMIKLDIPGHAPKPHLPTHPLLT